MTATIRSTQEASSGSPSAAGSGRSATTTTGRMSSPVRVAPQPTHRPAYAQAPISTSRSPKGTSSGSPVRSVTAGYTCPPLARPYGSPYRPLSCSVSAERLTSSAVARH
ncbi:hypothetical protein [Streptomyces noursei]|uniref:hypothetical protein n=1 Tax=Streptomyces noursei TaxID=1971 RepID=UPI0022A7B41B|nr:hypothetical protein [Streptomyces noursei]MCZ1020417.1 hypothetical protein [Streptomyces noursei]